MTGTPTRLYRALAYTARLMPLDPHKPLRDDVRLLGELLGGVIRDREGDDVFALVEQVRGLAKRGRAGADADVDALAARLATMPTAAALPLARAFAHFLTLANIAEQHHRIRRRRHYGRSPGASPQHGSCDQAFPALLASGVSAQRLRDAVLGLRIDLVLTAHPTEVVRRSLTFKHHRIAELLAQRDRSDLTATEREDLLDALRREVLAAWETDEVRHQRPTPIEEARAGLNVFPETLWQAVPRYARAVDRALRASTGVGLPLDVAPIRFSSWMGGDRDGNPYVTADVTRRACLLARAMAADLYHGEVDALRIELSMHAATDDVRARAGGAREPYRVVLRELRDRLARTRDAMNAALLDPATSSVWPTGADGELIGSAEDLAEPLRACAASLEATGNGELAEGRLADLLRRVAAFGVTLVRLDVRQDAERHTEALDAITRAIGIGSYAEWSEEERLAFLVRELDTPRPLAPHALEASEDVHEVLATFRMLADLPPESLGAYVISMASRASDVLAVALLQKDARVITPLRIVPLVETAASLEGAGAMIGALLDIPAYRARLGGRQEVMVGYSDSARDVGRFSAAWALYRAQEDIVAAARARGVAVTLFHGRGGSVGRGGGPTWHAIRAQPTGSIDGTLRVTEQGEMIQAKFGLPEIALRTLEVYTTATLEKTLVDRDTSTPEWRSLMDRLTSEATGAYRALVYDEPRFIEYFRAATPEHALSTLNIGSRPARRASGGGVRSLRAIPWQFAWTQTRLLTASWLGVERALAVARDGGLMPTLREMYATWPFFTMTMDLLEMVLAKADARIAEQYDVRLVAPALRPIGDDLRARLAAAIAGVLDVTGHDVLVQDTPVLRRSIDVRNPYVDPINLVQVELLRRERAGDTAVAEPLHVTINGIAAGLRNTG